MLKARQDCNCDGVLTYGAKSVITLVCASTFMLIAPKLAIKGGSMAIAEATGVAAGKLAAMNVIHAREQELKAEAKAAESEVIPSPVSPPVENTWHRKEADHAQV